MSKISLKITSISLIVILFSIFSFPLKSRAIFCANCSTNVQQAFQQIQETVSAVQTTVDTVNTTVLIPAQAVMTILQIIKSGEIMKSIILGKAGVDPLLIRKPQEYLKKESQKAARIIVEEPELQKTLKKTGVAKKIIEEEQYKALSIQKKVAQINQSPLLASSQRSLCTDAALSAQAKKDVSDSKGNYSQQAYTARKQALNNTLCGNIANPATQAAVSAASKKTVDWNSYITMGEGDNTWYKNQLTQQVVREEGEARKQAAAADLASGKGIVNKKKCLRRQIPGNENSVCLDEAISQTGELLNQQLKDYLKAPDELKKLGFTQGLGPVVQSMVGLAGAAFTAKNLFDSISYGFGGGGGGSNVSDDTFIVSNNSGSTVSSTAANDLTNNSVAKSRLVKTPLEQLTKEKDLLQKLSETVNNYISSATLERNNLDEVKNCYIDIINDHPEAVSDPRVSEIERFYTERSNSSSNKQTEAIKLRSNIIKGKEILSNIESKINTSESTEEIYNLFLGYQDQFKKYSIPDITTSTQVDADYELASQEILRSISADGDITAQKNNCNQLKSERGIQFNSNSFQGGV
jgi:hypothetical protein